MNISKCARPEKRVYTTGTMVLPCQVTGVAAHESLGKANATETTEVVSRWVSLASRSRFELIDNSRGGTLKGRRLRLFTQIG
jgi:hypothetical protein